MLQQQKLRGPDGCVEREGYLNGKVHKAALRIHTSDFSLMSRLNQLHKCVLCYLFHVNLCTISGDLKREGGFFSCQPFRLLLNVLLNCFSPHKLHLNTSPAALRYPRPAAKISRKARLVYKPSEDQVKLHF